jgi:RNA-directed DNA polymerase
VQTSDWYFIARKGGEPNENEEKQMTAKHTLSTGASSPDTVIWKDINWPAMESSVRRLQMRIAKAVQEGRHNKVKSLQWLLTHSFAAKLLATKRVTQGRGSKTPGVDGKICRTHKEKTQLAMSLQRRGYQAQPLRRVYIPKKSSTERRPLSIPTIGDRAMQALYLQALEPVMEMNADPHAYGFRQRRSTADAIEHCFHRLATKVSAQFILEGDIRKCFDRIDHQWLKDHVLMDKMVLSQWLSAGYMDNGTFYPTEGGTPQGGVASPCLAVMALSGLEQAVKSAVKARDKVHVTIYADDFIVTGASKEVLEQKVKPVIVDFLRERGLELSETKTKITHINDGFDFLGFNVRKYKGKLLIKPAKNNIKYFLANIRKIIKRNWATKTEELIKLLNPKITGWGNYYRHVVSKGVFYYVDDCIYRSLANWVKRRHPKKNATWWRKHYFRRQENRNWIFTAKDPENPKEWIDLLKMGYIPISRHVQIIGKATPFDERWYEYFSEREAKMLRRNIINRNIYKSRSGQVRKDKITE